MTIFSVKFTQTYELNNNNNKTYILNKKKKIPLCLNLKRPLNKMF